MSDKDEVRKARVDRILREAPSFVRLHCDHHRRPWHVVHFAWINNDRGWEEFHPGSAKQRRDQAPRPDSPEWTRTGDSQPRASDRQPDFVRLAGDEPISQAEWTIRLMQTPQLRQMDRLSYSGPLPLELQLRKVYPNKCGRCGRSVPRRQEKMYPLLDLLAAQRQRDVSLQAFALLAQEWDTRNGR